MSVSILNHVLGPIMRGPSSSHSAAALRIGRLARFLMNGNLREVDVFYDPNPGIGAFESTYATATDLGLTAADNIDCISIFYLSQPLILMRYAWFRTCGKWLDRSQIVLAGAWNWC